MAGIKQAFHHAPPDLLAGVKLKGVASAGEALCAWVEQWLTDVTDLPRLRAQRGRYARWRAQEEPGWVAPWVEEWAAAAMVCGPLFTSEPEEKNEVAVSKDLYKSSVLNREIGDRLRAARVAAGWGVYGARASLATAMGVSVDAVRSLERGYTGEDLLRRIAEHLQINLDWVRTGDGEMLCGKAPTPPPHGRNAAAEPRGKAVVAKPSVASPAPQSAITVAANELVVAKAAYLRAKARLHALLKEDEV